MSTVESTSLFFKQGPSDKEYHTQIVEQDGGYVVNFQYGRRGSALQSGTKTSEPISLALAQKVFNKLKAEKMAKGYSEGATTASSRPTVAPSRPTIASTPAPMARATPAARSVVILPQLLNTIEDPQPYIDDDAWAAQQKMDGERRMVVADGRRTIGTNKKGIEVPLPASIINSVKNICTLDGEIIGEKLFVFDILSHDGKDLTSRPFTERRKILKSLSFGPGIKVIETCFSQAVKQALFDELKAENREGIVFKKKIAPYTHGRPNSGGDAFKFKFQKTATFIVANATPGKRSVGLNLIDNESGERVFMGKVTIPPNYSVPEVGDLVEVRYLYAYRGGAIFQPVYLGKRTDSDLTDATMKQIIYKAERAAAGGSVVQGTRHEMEHADTIGKIKQTPNISTKEAAAMIAKDHLAEDPNYYKKLYKMENASTASSGTKQNMKTSNKELIEKWEKEQAELEILHDQKKIDDFSYRIESGKIARILNNLYKSTAASGTKTTTMITAIWQEALYYLKLGNIISEPRFNRHYKIIGYTKTDIRFVSASDISNKGSEDQIPYTLLVNKMDEGIAVIEGHAYENERDKSLLQNEINGIAKTYEIEEERCRAAELEQEVDAIGEHSAATEAAHESHVSAFGDTIKGMEALAGGGRFTETDDETLCALIESLSLSKGTTPKNEKMIQKMLSDAKKEKEKRANAEGGLATGCGGKVNKLLLELKDSLEKKDLIAFNDTSNKIHEISDGDGLTESEYEAWDDLREQERKLRVSRFLNSGSMAAAGKGRTITFDDGFQFKVVDFDYAKKNWNKEQIYKIFEDEQTESLIDDIRRVYPNDVLAVEIGFKNGSPNAAAGRDVKKKLSRGPAYAFKRGDNVRVARIITSLNNDKAGKAGVVTQPLGRRAYAVTFVDDTTSAFTSEELELMPGAAAGKGGTIKGSKQQNTLMRKYAKACGYDTPPKPWRPTDYTVAGWKKLIRESKHEAAGGKKAEWLVEHEDGIRKIVATSKKPQKGRMYITTEEEGGKKIIVTKVIGKANAAAGKKADLSKGEKVYFTEGSTKIAAEVVRFGSPKTKIEMKQNKMGYLIGDKLEVETLKLTAR